DDRGSRSVAGVGQGDAETVAGQGCEPRVASLDRVVEECVIQLERTCQVTAQDEETRQACAAHTLHRFVPLVVRERPRGLEVRYCAILIDLAEGVPERCFRRCG